VGACRRTGVEPNVEVIETRPAQKRSFQNGRLAVAAEGYAREAAYHKKKG
jgi:hypothetical protein